MGDQAIGSMSEGVNRHKGDIALQQNLYGEIDHRY